MDAIFAILVLGAVIFFGALISAGNERQRKAIDGIREQAAQWAMQDLRLKREHLARDVKVDDPVAWLNRVVAKVVGEDLRLTVIEVFDNPQAVMCMTGNGEKVVFSLSGPDKIARQISNKKKLPSLNNHPLLQYANRIDPVQINLLNSNVCFDLEIRLAWTHFFEKSEITNECLWMYK